MAGPTASVLLNFSDAPPTWRDLVSPYAFEWVEDLCYISGTLDRYSDDDLRPFVGGVDNFATSNPDYSQAAIEAICNTIGARFTHALHLAAMCNRTVDHKVLCRTLGGVAKELGGIVDFDVLDAPLQELGMIKCEWAGDDPARWTVLGDFESCNLWINHPCFHMVK